MTPELKAAVARAAEKKYVFESVENGWIKHNRCYEQEQRAYTQAIEDFYEVIMAMGRAEAYEQSAERLIELKSEGATVLKISTGLRTSGVAQKGFAEALLKGLGE
jgi:hypothetical protein